MASRKKGFIYSNWDNNFWRDEKIRRLNYEKKLDGKGILVYQYIITQSNLLNGCYITADESFLFEIAEYFKISMGLVEEIILVCVNVGLLAGEPLITNNARKKAGQRISGYLTSRALQQRYVLQWKFSNRFKYSDIEIPDFVKLLSDDEILELLNKKDIEAECHFSEKSNDFSEKSNDFSENQQERKGKENKEKKNFSSSFKFNNSGEAIALWLEKNRGKNADPIVPALTRWFEYKKTRGEMYENLRGLRACISKLYNIYEDCNFNAAVADFCIDRAISRNDVGFFMPSQRQINKLNIINLHQNGTQTSKNKRGFTEGFADKIRAARELGRQEAAQKRSANQ